jgi:uncharacterized protein involved in propanediol utilization
VQRQDVELLARVASGSAKINERFLPNPAFPYLSELERRGVTLGSVVAHSGTLAGALFKPNDHTGLAEARRVLADAGFGNFHVFTTAHYELVEELAA